MSLRVSAFFANGQTPVRAGLQWRVYADQTDASQTIVARSTGSMPSFSLCPAPTSSTRPMASRAPRSASVSSRQPIERLAVNAGALQLMGAVSGSPIPADRLTFSVYVPVGQNSEGRLVIANAKAGDMIRLPEGTYHVVSTYGDANAIMRSDLKVETGRVTEATLNHRAATVTLKLVALRRRRGLRRHGLQRAHPGGDVIREAIGAFPSVTLAEGDYVLIARHEGKVHTREFKVESGLDRDIEVIAK